MDLSILLFVLVGVGCSRAAGTAEGKCIGVEVAARHECGPAGISQSACETNGCCFDNSIPGTVWCFYPLGSDACGCNTVEPDERQECGWAGISRHVCESRGCCFENSTPDVKWCFQPPRM